MKVVEKIITLEDVKEPLTIIPIGDLHIGSSNTDKVYLKKTIDWIKNKKNCYTILMGDMVEAIIPTDKRFDIRCVDKEFQNDLSNLPLEQIKYLKKLLYPIRHKIITSLEGNHEEKFKLHNYIDLQRELCEYLGVERGDYMTFVRLKFNREQFHCPPIVIWCTHGWFEGRKRGGKINQLEDVAAGYDFDIALAGHSHDLFATSSLRIGLASTGKQIYSKKKIFCNTGTFVNTVSMNSSSYAEKRAYTPKKVGVIRIDVYLKHHGPADIHIRE